MRVLVTGSRDWTDRKLVRDELDKASALVGWENVTVVHGACPTGADWFAHEWCEMFQEYDWLHEERHPADWNTFGKRAGYVRNQEMVDAGADLCLAFIKKNSRGATMCATLAERAGIPVRYFRED